RVLLRAHGDAGPGGGAAAGRGAGHAGGVRAGAGARAGAVPSLHGAHPRACEPSRDLNAQVVATVQGLGEIVAYGRMRAWGELLAAKARRFSDLRLPFLRDLARQTALQETATGLGGLAVAAVGAWLVHGGRLDPAALPLLTLLALSAFVPLWEVAQVGRQLADTL